MAKQFQNKPQIGTYKKCSKKMINWSLEKYVVDKEKKISLFKNT